MIRGDPIEPSSELAFTVERAEPSYCLDQNLLSDFLSIMGICALRYCKSTLDDAGSVSQLPPGFHSSTVRSIRNRSIRRQVRQMGCAWLGSSLASKAFLGGLSLAYWTLNFTDCDSVDWKLKNKQSIRYLPRESTKKPACRINRQAGNGLFRCLELSSTVYSSIASTSTTNRWLLSARNALITLNTESLKPPMFMMSARSQA